MLCRQHPEEAGNNLKWVTVSRRFLRVLLPPPLLLPPLLQCSRTDRLVYWRLGLSRTPAGQSNNHCGGKEPPLPPMFNDYKL